MKGLHQEITLQPDALQPDASRYSPMRSHLSSFCFCLAIGPPPLPSPFSALPFEPAADVCGGLLLKPAVRFLVRAEMGPSSMLPTSSERRVAGPGGGIAGDVAGAASFLNGENLRSFFSWRFRVAERWAPEVDVTPSSFSGPPPTRRRDGTSTSSSAAALLTMGAEQEPPPAPAPVTRLISIVFLWASSYLHLAGAPLTLTSTPRNMLPRTGLGLLIASLGFCVGLDAKWTPNGEAPAPFSTNARQQMGIDPAAFAGQTTAQQPLQVPGATLRFNLVTLVAVYLANNWKLVLAVQDIVMKLLQPFLSAQTQRKEAQAEAARLDSVAAARKARLERLKRQQAGDSEKPRKAVKRAKQ